VLGWAFSWTSPLSPRPPGGIPVSEATQGEYKVAIKKKERNHGAKV